MKRKIALYSLYGNGEYPKLVTDWVENDKDYTRLVEPVEVTFTERDHAEVVLEQIDALKIKRDGVRAEMGAKIAVIDEDIQKLMAIEHSTIDKT